MKYILLLLTIILLAPASFAQNQHLIDSLKTQLENQRTQMTETQPSAYDTAVVKILYQLSVAYWNNDLKMAEDFAREALSLAEKIDYQPGIANAYNSLGVIYDNKSDFFSALEFYNKSLKIREAIGDNTGMAKVYNNIGSLYTRQNKLEDALRNHLMSLKIKEQLGLKNGIAISSINIGNIYFNLEDYSKSLEYYFKALNISEEIKDKEVTSVVYTNIAGVNLKQKNYEDAFKNYSKALEIYKERGDKIGISNAYLNLGALHYEQDQYLKALMYYDTALDIKTSMQDMLGIANIYNNIAKVYIEQKKYQEAEKYLNLALEIGNEINSIDIKEKNAEALASVYFNQGNYKASLETYKLFIALRDTILNDENINNIAELQMQYDFDKKESLLKAENEKELSKQKLVRNSFVGGTILFLLLAGAIFIGLRKTEREKKKSEELLLNILPAEVAQEIKTTGTAKAKSFTMVTVMFTDFMDFTTVSERVSAELLVDEIHTCFSAFDNILQKYKIEKIKTIGDAYLCASGLPVSNYTHAVDMLNAAFEIRDYMIQRKKVKEAKDEIPFELRIGIHTGPLVAGIVGVKKFAYDIWGDTVNLAARMEQNSEAGKINISGTTYELVKDKFNCTYRGKIQAKNKGEIDMYFAENNS